MLTALLFKKKKKATKININLFSHINNLGKKLNHPSYTFVRSYSVLVSDESFPEE